jgi:hypothetical protein
MDEYELLLDESRGYRLNWAHGDIWEELIQIEDAMINEDYCEAEEPSETEEPKPEEPKVSEVVEEAEINSACNRYLSENKWYVLYVDTYKTLTGEKKALISAENFFKRLPESIEYTRNMVKYYKGKLEEVREKVESDLESKNIESILTEMNEVNEVNEVVHSTHTPIEKQTVVVHEEWEKEKYDSLDADYGYNYRTKKAYKKTPAKDNNKLWKGNRVAYAEYLETVKKAGGIPIHDDFTYGFLPKYKNEQKELQLKQEKHLKKQAKEEAKRLKYQQELERFLKKNPTATEADFLESKKIKVVLVDRVAEQPDFIDETSASEVDENATEEEKKALEVEKEEEKALEKQAESDYNTAFVGAVLQDLPVEVVEEIVTPVYN